MKVIELKKNNEIFYVNCEIIRKRVKNINFKIKPDGLLVISCPNRISDKELNDIICKRQDWIINTVNKMKSKEQVKKLEEINFVNGEKYRLLGKDFNVNIERKTNNKNKSNDTIVNDVTLNGTTISIYINLANYQELDKESNNELDKDKIINEKVSKVIRTWERNLLKEEIQKILVKHKHLLRYLNIESLDISIKQLRATWGICCPSKKTISLNKELVRYDKECLEYVVIHELSHIKHPNHSRDFYNLIESYMPNYKEARNKLK